MHCAKVLLSCFEKNFRHKKLIPKRNFVIGFSYKCDKVELSSTLSIMEDLYDPPSGVRGMTKLDRNAFKKTIKVPCLIVDNSNINEAQKVLKKYLLKISAIKPLKKMENDKFSVLIDSKVITSWNDFDKNTLEKLQNLNISEDNFSLVSVDLGYENWSAQTLLKAILPSDVPPLTSYSIIGHIIHLNIKEELLDYKHVIGEILFDKSQQCKTVIYKKNVIDNVYRNFELELLCGEPNFIASISQNQCRFDLDFSKVYWNPRLCTEHMRIVDEIKEKDILFDVFAGVGPFAIPAAKKKCIVFANDLNPESVKWLRHNITLNKKAKDFITTYNKDGKDFILEDIRQNLIKTFKDDLFNYKIHVVMNLPAIAPTFMKYFNKLIKKTDLVDADINQVKKCLPIINCYLFVRDNECQKAVFEEASQMNLSNIKHNFHFVRKVSTGKAMFRVTFILPFEYLVGEEEDVNSIVEPDEPLAKRSCTR